MSTRTPHWSATWLPSLVLATAFLLLLYPATQGRHYASFDVWAQALPFRMFYSLCLEQGETGYWCPLFWRGFAQLGAGETGVFHPLNQLLYRVLSVNLAWTIFSTLAYPLGFAGAFLLLRRTSGYERPAAILGAGAFAAGTAFLPHFGQAHLVLVAAHLPWILLTVEYAWHEPRRRALAAALFGLLCASMLLLCHPQSCYLVLLGTAIAIGYRLLERPGDGERWRTLGILALGGLAGLAVGMLQLLPTWHQLQLSLRGQLSPLERENFSLHPLHLLNNLAPWLWADGNAPGDLVYQPDHAPAYRPNASEFTAYWGLSCLSLLWVWLVLHGRELLAPARRRTTLYLGACLAAAALLMLGKYGGLNEWLSHVPLLAQFRAPDRYKLLVSVILALALAHAWTQLARGQTRPPARPQYLALAAWLLLVLGIALWAHWQGGIAFRGQALRFSAWPWLLGGVAMAVAAVLLALALARGRGWAGGLLAALCLADLCSAGLPLVARVDYRSFAEVDQARAALASNDRLDRVIALDNLPLWQGQYLATGYTGMNPADPPKWQSLAELRLAAIRLLIGPGGSVRPVPDPLPRFRLLPELRLAEQPLQALASLDLRQVALCEPGAAAPFRASPLAAGEDCFVAHDGNDRLALTVTAFDRRVLAVADRPAPGWQAFVDGQEVPLVPLFSGLARGLMLEAGSHRVEMRYTPPGLRAGKWWAMLGLAGLLALLASSVAANRVKTPLGA